MTALIGVFKALLNAHLPHWREAEAKLNELCERDEEVLVTIGLSYRNPTVHDAPCRLDEIEGKFDPKGYLCTADRYPRDGRVHLNLLTANDMY